MKIILSFLCVIYFFHGCSSKNFIEHKEYEIKKNASFLIINPYKDPIFLTQTIQKVLKNYGHTTSLAHATLSKNNSKKIKLTQGSGFFINDKGHVVTNHHVIDGLDEVFIQTNDKKSFVAKVAHKDNRNDLAILIPVKTYQAKFWFDIMDTHPTIGANINVIGFPLSNILGTDIRITQGIISSEKGIKSDDRQFQISAPIQPGNSGGPIVDKNLTVVGVATARLSDKYLLDYMDIIPQNINFGVKSTHLHTFMNKYNIENPKSSISTLNDATKATVLVHNAAHNQTKNLAYPNHNVDYKLTYEYVYHWEFDTISYLIFRLSTSKEEIAFIKYTGDSLSSPASIAEDLLNQILKID